MQNEIESNREQCLRENDALIFLRYFIAYLIIAIFVSIIDLGYGKGTKEL